MKKSVFLALSLCSLLLITGCENPLSEGGSENSSNSSSEYSLYEIHYFDEDFNHTEEIEAAYDKNGNLKKLEMYMVYPEITDDDGCNSWRRNYHDIVDLDYPGVEATCTITDKGGKLYYAMTDESLKAGYLSDENENYRLDFENQYELLSYEEIEEQYLGGTKNEQQEKRKQTGYGN